MKIKHLALAVAGMAFSTAVLATTPGNYDTRFNVSAQVPDSVLITDPDGKPVTEVDIRLTPNGSGHATADTMSADTATMGKALRLWSNSSSDTKVKLTLDDSNVATGSAFTLNSTNGGQLNKMTYKVSTVDTAGKVTFNNSGDDNDYTLTPVGTHAEREVAFVFESTAAYNTYTEGAYGGIVYANVTVAP